MALLHVQEPKFVHLATPPPAHLALEASQRSSPGTPEALAADVSLQASGPASPPEMAASPKDKTDDPSARRARYFFNPERI